MKRTHRQLLVLNYAVAFKDNDDLVYMEYHQLKKYLSRQELVNLYRKLKQGGDYSNCLYGADLESNAQVNQVVGV